MRHHWINFFIVRGISLAFLCGLLQSCAAPTGASLDYPPTARSQAGAAATIPIAATGILLRPTSPFSIFLPVVLQAIGQPGQPATVFLIMMENHNWSEIYNKPSAPYINHSLLPAASYARQYFNPAGLHPSEPNYLWLEAGTNFGIYDDNGPAQNHQSTPAHLVTLLAQAGISWKSYQEDIPGNECPLGGIGLYEPKHNPMVFFDDITNTNDRKSVNCITHVRPYTELATDLQMNTVPRYAFITPNLCHDMHGAAACVLADQVSLGDTWLSTAVPPILASAAYRSNGVLIITWDEGSTGDGPIGMIVLSSLAKGGGYTNTVHYTHSSTLRTLEEIFGVTPLLGDAALANDLSDLFTRLP